MISTQIKIKQLRNDIPELNGKLQNWISGGIDVINIIIANKPELHHLSSLRKEMSKKSQRFLEGQLNATSNSNKRLKTEDVLQKENDLK